MIRPRWPLDWPPSPRSLANPLVLRGLQLRRQAKRCGRGPYVHRGVRYSGGRDQLLIGDDVRLFEDVRLFMAAPDATIAIGDRTYVNRRSEIVSADQVTIGADCALSWDVIVTDSDFHWVSPGGPVVQTVTIEDRVWIGARATILKGVTIGTGAIVAAGAVVTNDVAPQTMVAGVPARVIRDHVAWWE